DAPAIYHATHHDYLGFVADELPRREELGVPPFGRLVRLIARGPDEAAVRRFMDRLAESLRGLALPEIRFLGPSPAPGLKIRNLHRSPLRLKAKTAKPLQTLLQAASPAMSPPGEIELAVDVDPISLL